MDSGNSKICDVCLSEDRYVGTFTNEFLLIFQTLAGKNHLEEVKLCWECCAILQKVIRIKEKIEKAQNVLINVVEKSIKSLSTLKQTQCIQISCINFEPSDIIGIGDLIKTENSELQTYIEKQNVNDRIYKNQEELTSYRENQLFKRDFKVLESQPKVIVYSHSCSEIDDDFENHDSLNVEETAIKTIDDFDESDEEPLKIKTKCKKEKKQNSGRRREKDSGVVNNARVLKKLQQLNVTSDHLEMVILSWEEVESERQQNIASAKFLSYAHKCYQCALGFNHKCKLDEHMKKHQPSAGSAECEVCHIFCKDQQALGSHRRRHRVRWRCVLCGGRWSRASVAADHAHRLHAAPAPTHRCSLCGHCAQTLGQLRNHMKKAHSGQHKCELCEKVFRDKTSLRTHLFIHKGEKEYSCPKCNKQFLFKKAMEIHLVTHDSSANLYCYQCDMTFKNQMSFNQHMKYNLKHVDPARLKYACELCDKKFVKATRLEEHKMAVHLKITPIACTTPGCQFACSSRAVLRTHRRSAHAQLAQKRDHVCDMCGKAYTTKKSLEGHLRMHSGERPFRCAKCPAAFGYEAALYNHNKLVHLKHKVNRNRVQPTSNWVTVDVPDIQ